jgi:hypothetical protein
MSSQDRPPKKNSMLILFKSITDSNHVIIR